MSETKMAQWVKMPTSKPDYLNSIPRSSELHMRTVAHVHKCTHVHTHTGTFINTKKSLNDDRGAILVINIYAPNNRAPN